MLPYVEEMQPKNGLFKKRGLTHVSKNRSTQCLTPSRRLRSLGPSSVGEHTQATPENESFPQDKCDNGLEFRECFSLDEAESSGFSTEDAINQSRRGWLKACLTGMSLTSLSLSPAKAFPSPALEGLQESCSTSASPGQKAGINALRDPAIYRGAATDKAVRRVYSLDGLLPVSRFGIQQEIDRAKLWVDRCCDPLSKYQALITLKETNRDAFFGLLSQNVEAYLPVVYTPTVGKACQEWSHLLHRPTGLYISIADLGHVRLLVNNWAESDVRVAVLTDGERILGLGDLGANGLGIPVGKSIVHSLGGLHPRHLLPIVVDVGCNTPEVREDPLYIGLKQERVRGSQYDQLIDETLQALRDRFGASVLIHWEDFGSKNSYRLLARARSQEYSTFNDDIESTAAAVLAAVYGATQLGGVPPLREQIFVMLGAGQANIGSARLLVRALVDEGLEPQQARDRIWMFDSKGLISERDQKSLSAEKQEFQRNDSVSREIAKQTVAQAVSVIKPTALIGATAKKGSFDKTSVQNLMQGIIDRFGKGARPIILALSNPDTQAECTAEEAYDWTEGRAVYASGTTFKPFQRDGRQVVPSQANNSLIFPGVGLGCTAVKATSVTEDMMLSAAKAVALKLTEEEVAQSSILPATSRLREVALGVAAAVALSAAENMVATSGDLLGCLPKDRDVDSAQALAKAEICIAKLRYEPICM